MDDRFCSACGQLNHDEEDGVFDCGHSREAHNAYLVSADELALDAQEAALDA